MRKLELPLEGLEALQSYAFQRTVGLILSRTDRLENASGVPVTVGARSFVATAGHNLINHGNTQIALVHLDEIDHHQVPFLARWPERGAPCPEPDIGYLEVGPEAVARSSKKFVPLGDLSFAMPTAGMSALLIGYPSERVRRPLLAQDLIYLGAVAIHTQVCPNPKRSAHAASFAVRIEPRGTRLETRRPMSTPALAGMSGGGVWSVPAERESGIWSAQGATLLGIQYSYHRGDGLAIATSMRAWLELVADHYSDLRQQILQHLQR